MSMKTNWKGLVLVGLISSASTIAGLKFLAPDHDKDVIFKEAASENIARFTSAGAPAGAPATSFMPPRLPHQQWSILNRLLHANNPVGNSRSPTFSGISSVTILVVANAALSNRKQPVRV